MFSLIKSLLAGTHVPSTLETELSMPAETMDRVHVLAHRGNSIAVGEQRELGPVMADTATGYE
jgi:hypothetical protein